MSEATTTIFITRDFFFFASSIPLESFTSVDSPISWEDVDLGLLNLPVNSVNLFFNLSARDKFLCSSESFDKSV